MHSPFVYDLITKCFYDHSPYPEYAAIKHYRQELKDSPAHIEVTDLGSGSKTLKTSTRSVKQMVSVSSSTTSRTRLLFRLARYLQPKEVLELGTSLGVATQALALGHPESRICSIEGCPQTFALAQAQLKKQHLQNLTLLNAPFSEALPQLNTPQYDLVFIDGHHEEAATLQYFEQLLPKAHNDSVFIFDDIHWSAGMQSAWKQVAAHPSVRVSIDTFFWGLVFFRKEQAREHFKIRL